jgi:hypothetical protein
MTDPNLDAAIRTHALLDEALAVKRLDSYTLAAAEKAVRDMIAKTSWASDARLLKRAADAIHKLGEAS